MLFNIRFLNINETNVIVPAFISNQCCWILVEGDLVCINNPSHAQRMLNVHLSRDHSTAYAPPVTGPRSVTLLLRSLLDLYIAIINHEGSVGTVHIRRFAWTFPGRRNVKTSFHVLILEMKQSKNLMYIHCQRGQLFVLVLNECRKAVDTF